MTLGLDDLGALMGVGAPAADGPTRAMLYCINYAPEMIGVGRYAGELGAYLTSRGVQVEVVTTPPRYPGWKVGVSVRNRPAAVTKSASVGATPGSSGRAGLR